MLQIAGDFTSTSDGQTAKYVTSFDPTAAAGSQWGQTAFSTNGLLAPSFSLYAMPAAGGQATLLYIGGGSSVANKLTAGGQLGTGRIVAYDGSEFSYVTAADAAASRGGVDSDVFAIGQIGTSIVIGGQFSYHQVDSALAPAITKFVPGGAWGSLLSDNANGLPVTTSAKVMGMAASGSRVYVGGQFTALANGASANNIFAYNVDTKAVEVLATGSTNGLDSEVSALAVISNRLYVSGTFRSFNKQATLAQYVAYWDIASSTWYRLQNSGGDYGNGFNARMNAIVGLGGYVFFFGTCRIMKGGAMDSASKMGYYNPATDTVHALYNDGTVAGASGPCSGAGTPPCNGVGGNNDPSKNVVAAVEFQGKVYFAGDFTQTSAGTPLNRIGAISSALAWSTLDCAGACSGTGNGLNNDVAALAVFQGTLWITGSFTGFGTGGTGALSNFVGWSGTEWVLPSCGRTCYGLGGASTMTQWGELLVFAGFTIAWGANNNPHDNSALAARGALTWTGGAGKSAWGVLATGMTNGFATGKVLGMASAKGNLYVGGIFTQLADGTPASYMAMWS